MAIQFSDLSSDERLCLLVVWTFPGATIAPDERAALFGAARRGLGAASPETDASFAATLARLTDFAISVEVIEQHFSRQKLWFCGGPPVISATVPRIADPKVEAQITRSIAEDPANGRLARRLLVEALDETWVAHPTRPLHVAIPKVRKNAMHLRGLDSPDAAALIDKVCCDIPDNHVLDAALGVLARQPQLANEDIVDRLDKLAQRPEEHIAFSLAKHLAPVVAALPDTVTLLLLGLALRREEALGDAQAFVTTLLLDRYEQMTGAMRDVALRAFEALIDNARPGPAAVVCHAITRQLASKAPDHPLLAAPGHFLRRLATAGDHLTRGSVADVLHASPLAARAEFSDLHERLSSDPSSYVRACLTEGQCEAEESFW